MINIEEFLISKELGKTRISSMWSRGRMGTNHPSSETVLQNKKNLENLE
jgi:hypothetical protein